MNLKPLAFSSSVVFSMSSTPKAMWCNPSPLSLMNLARVLSSLVGSRNSTLVSPAFSSATFAFWPGTTVFFTWNSPNWP